MDRLTVHQHLTIRSVRRSIHGLKIKVRDQEGARQWIDFRMPRAQSEVCLERLREWRDRTTYLTYVCGAQHGMLVDDSELFAAAYFC